MVASAAARKKALSVIVDSNALFVPLQFKIDIFAELERLLNRNFELVLLSSVKRELEILSEKNSPKTRRNASFALSLAEKGRYVKVPDKPNETTDDTIVRTAQKWNSPVFTNDKALKKRLRNINVPVIYVREKSRLEIDGLM